jgi:uncharacterized membrane protein
VRFVAVGSHNALHQRRQDLAQELPGSATLCTSQAPELEALEDGITRRLAIACARTVSTSAVVPLLVYGAALAFGVLTAIGSTLEQSRFELRRYDLGNFTQAIWSTAHGHFLSVTEVGGEQVSRLAVHVDPIILLLVPVWWVWSTPVVLLAVQAIALAAGAVPLFWLAREHLNCERDAAFVAAAYLMCPIVEWNAVREFHAVALSVPLLLLAIWFLDRGRIASFIGAAALAILCKEQIGLLVAGIGLWSAWRHRRPALGAAIAVAGAAVTGADFVLVLRHFSAGGSPYLGRYAAIGGSFAGIVHTLITDPLTFVRVLQPEPDLWALLLLSLPVLGLCYRSALVLVALPQVALVVFSDRAADLDTRSQTLLAIVPFVYAATVFALARRRDSGWVEPGHVLLSSAVVALFFGPLVPVLRQHPPAARLEAERRAVAMIPADAPVSSTNILGAHLAARRSLYVFPLLGDARWVVVDVHDPWLPLPGWLQTRSGLRVGMHDLYFEPALMHAELARLIESDGWRQVYSSSGIRVFHRVDGNTPSA